MDLSGAKLDSDAELWLPIDEGMKAIRSIPGMTCEIGVRRGGTSARIMDAIQESGIRRDHICIDPYGDLALNADGHDFHYGYDNRMRDETVSLLFAKAQYNPLVNLRFFNLTDAEFFSRFGDGVPTYNDKIASVENRYAFVFVDGQHERRAVEAAVEFFHPRTAVGSVLVFDNTEMYPHHLIEQHYLNGLGWELLCFQAHRKAYVRKELSC